MTPNTTETAHPPTGREPVGGAELRCWIAVVAGLSLLGFVGFAVSFEQVNHRMIPYFGGLAWTVPLAVDVGILIFTALDLLMAQRDIRSVWLRYVPRALIAVTIYLNVVGETALEGRVAHAVLPLVWAIAVEVAGVAVRTIFGLKTHRVRLDRIPRTMWLLAPVATARLRRRMVMRQETSLAAATARHLAYDLAKADLRDQYGPVLWRWKAPRRTRILLRRGEITPADGLALTLTGTTDGTGPETTIGTTSETAPGINGTGPGDRSRPAAKTTGGRSRTGRKDRSRRSWDELVAAAETVAAQMIAEGEALTRRPFMTRMADIDHPVGTDRAKALLEHVHGIYGDGQPATGTPETRPTDSEDPPATAAA